MNFICKRQSRSLVMICIFLTCFLFCGCQSETPPESESQSTAAQKSATGDENRIEEKTIEDFQVELIELGFKTASLIPSEPFIKDRARAMELVVDTCLQLDQPVRAVRYSDRIDNWRRGLCYAKAANYLVKKGYGYEDVKKGLEAAEKIAQVDHGQQWRSDQIKVKIASAYLHLGMVEEAGLINENLGAEQAGKVQQFEASMSKKENFDKHIAAMDALVALHGFETTKNALYGYAELFNRFYSNPERRSIAEEKIKASWQKLPIPIRLEVMMKLASYALDNNDRQKALELVNEAQVLLDDYQWPLESYIPNVSNLTKIRFQTGDKEKSVSILDKAKKMFDENGRQIIDIYRAEAIIPLAEAYKTVGDNETSLEVYKLAVKEGLSNPNIRPRAEDISAVCCSMAAYSVRPDAEVLADVSGFIRESAQ